MVEPIGVKPDFIGCLKTTRQATIQLCEELFATVRDQHIRHPWSAIQVVQRGVVFELIDFVEDHYIGRVVVIVDSIDEFVRRGGLAVNIEGLVDPLRNAVEQLVSGVVLPAIDVLGGDVDDFLAELIDSVLGDTGLPRA